MTNGKSLLCSALESLLFFTLNFAYKYLYSLYLLDKIRCVVGWLEGNAIAQQFILAIYVLVQNIDVQL